MIDATPAQINACHLFFLFPAAQHRCLMSLQRLPSLFHSHDHHHTARSATIVFIPDPRLSQSVVEHDGTSTYLYEMTCWIDPEALSRILLATPRCVRVSEAPEVDADTGEVSAVLWEWVGISISSLWLQ